MKQLLTKMRMIVAATLLVVIALVSGGRANAIPFLDFHDFAGAVADGNQPQAALVQDPVTKLYFGTTRIGGKFNRGTLFVVTPALVVHVIHNFAGPEGQFPTSTLIVVQPKGNVPLTVYGTASSGGKKGLGVVFSDTVADVYHDLHDFLGAPADGSSPYAGVIRASDGFLYGTTVTGGKFNQGTTYRLPIGGGGTVITHNFVGNAVAGVPPDGAKPFARLLEFRKGVVAGTTVIGGKPNLGTLFVENLNGAGYNIIHAFVGGLKDGSNPTAEVIQTFLPTGAPILWGTALNQGANGDGIVYVTTATGAPFVDTYDFAGGLGDGAHPFGALVQANDGNLYGTTEAAGALGSGTVYQIKPGAPVPVVEAVLHNFGAGAGGGTPTGALIQSLVDKNLYGTTRVLGKNNDGTLFWQIL